MPGPLELSSAQSFDKERFTRAINQETDVKALRSIAVLLLNGWFTQRAVTKWLLGQSLDRPATVVPSQVSGIGFQVEDETA